MLLTYLILNSFLTVTVFHPVLQYVYITYVYRFSSDSGFATFICTSPDPFGTGKQVL
jgi:hypothetical protein